MAESTRQMSRDERIEAVARVCHEANRAWCLAHGDNSQVNWSSAPAWQRESAIEGVREALTGKGPEGMHEAWMESKLAQGWTHGLVKDEKAKTHPCLVPYEELPAFQRTKDSLFLAVVSALAPALGL